MDYKKLLMKYIGHILYEEGTALIEDIGISKHIFTEEEWQELLKLEDEVERLGFYRNNTTNIPYNFD